MRWFADTSASRKQGEACLVGADSVAIVSAILFATGIPSAWGSIFDAILLALWAVVPRHLSRVFDQLLNHPNFVKSFAASVGIVLLTVLLFMGGTVLMGQPDFDVDYGTMSLVCLTWSCGYLMFRPRFYLIQDLLLFGVVCLGLTMERPDVWIWLPVFLVSIALSATSRHQIHEVFAEFRNPSLNLHNARSLAVLSMVIFVVAFGLLSWGLREVWIRVDYNPTPILQVRSAIPEESGSYGEGVPVVFQDPANPTTNAPDVPSAPGEEQRGGNREAGTIVGYTQKVRLGALRKPKRDFRAVLLARLVSESTENTVSVKGPLRAPLWKGISLSRFVPEDESWETIRPAAAIERAGHRILASEPRVFGTAATFEMKVLLPAFDTLVRPYHASAYWQRPPQEWGGFRRNRHGDVYPARGIPAGARYFVEIQDPPWILPPFRARVAPDAASEFLEVPDAEQLGVDLRAVGNEIFGSSRSLRGQIDRLRTHFASNFFYDDQHFWAPNQRCLATFLTEKNFGNCEYFATATALLLRTRGVPTRVAVGFVGGDWLPRGNFYRIRNERAHLWTEVKLADLGWVPLDPTSWVTRQRPSSDPETPSENPDLASNDNSADGGETGETDSDGASRDRGLRFTPLERRPGSGLAGNDSGTGSSFGEDPWGDPDTPFEPEVGAGWLEEGTEWAPPENPTEDAEKAVATAGTDDRSVVRTHRRIGSSPTNPEPPASALDRSIRPLLGLLVLVAGFVALLSYRRTPVAKEDDREEAPPEFQFVATTNAGTPAPPRPRAWGEIVLWEYHRLQRDLQHVRHHRHQGQTPREHGAQYPEPPALSEQFRIVLDAVYAVLYGSEEVDEECSRQVGAACHEIRRQLLRRTQGE